MVKRIVKLIQFLIHKTKYYSNLLDRVRNKPILTNQDQVSQTVYQNLYINGIKASKLYIPKKKHFTLYAVFEINVDSKPNISHDIN